MKRVMWIRQDFQEVILSLSMLTGGETETSRASGSIKAIPTNAVEWKYKEAQNGSIRVKYKYFTFVLTYST